MRKNKLGSSDLYVSEVGFGCMSLGLDQEINERLIHEAIDLGINFFDTADLYDKGKNEESLGLALKGKRNDILIATKGGNDWSNSIDGWHWNPTKAYLKQAVKKSLRRLGTDYIDLYQLHGGTIEDNIEETIEAFEEMVQEGIIRYYGISSIRPNVIKAYLTKSNIVSIMMQYSLLDRRPEEWLGIIKDHEVSVIARGPVAKGILTDENENKITSKGYLDYTQEDLKATVEGLRNIATEEFRSLHELAIRYVVDHPAVATAIPGASKLHQLQTNALASQANPISDSLRDKLQRVTKQSFYESHR